MRFKSELMAPVVVLIIFGVVVGFLIYGGGALLGLDSDDINTIVILVPGLIAILFGFYAVRMSDGYILGAAVLGMGMAVVFLLHLMDETSLIVDEPTLSISVIQILVIVIFMVLAIGSVMKER